MSFLWITMINHGYIDFCKNFLLSMKKSNVSFKLIIYCIDKECINALSEFDNCICMDASVFIKYDLNSNFTTWGYKDYIKITFSKLDSILYTLKNNTVDYVGYIDTDIILFSDPTDIIIERFQQNPNIKIISQCDESMTCCDVFHCSQICSGVIAFKNEEILYPLFHYNDDALDNFTSDQEYLMSKIHEYSIPYLTVEKDIFINGPHIWKMEYPATFSKKTCLLHFNYMIGIEKKDHMKRLNYWYL